MRSRRSWLPALPPLLLLALTAACSAGSGISSSGVNTDSASGVLLHFDACNGTGGQDAQGTTALQGAARWTAGKLGCAIELDGHTSAVNVTGAGVDTTQSFSVAAWVALGDPNAVGTIVSQDGASQSAFALRYGGATTDGGNGVLEWVIAAIDDPSDHPVVLRSFLAVPTQIWTHVAATYDASAHQASLYIDGVLQAQAAVTQTFAASGHVVVGRGLSSYVPIQWWNGRVDEVHVSPTVLTPASVAQLRAQAPAITPVRPPATPLVVRDPYVNAWSLDANFAGQWPAFWTTTIKALTVAFRVDGIAYVAIGDPGASFTHATLRQMEVTPTQTKLTFTGSSVAVHVNFTGNYDPNDLQTLSAPLGVMTMQAQSLDGLAHDVQFYSDVSAEWASGDTSTLVTWQSQTINSSSGLVHAFGVTPSSPNTLMETDDAADWGTEVFGTSGDNLSMQSGADATVRAQFVATGAMANTQDPNQPRAISDHWPVFAFAYALPNTTGAMSEMKTFVIGQVRQPGVSYLGNNIAPLWQSYWSSWGAMAGDIFAAAQSGVTLVRCAALDAQVNADAVRAGGSHYAAICALALRQVFGGLQLVNTPQDPWLFLREISSDGNVSTVDVIYPTSPALMYLRPVLLRYLLRPVFVYCSSGNWPQPFAVHDLGASYPNANGHNDGGGENMPVEESANMLIMTAAYARMAGDANATAFVQQNYTQLSQWANYLVANALDPNYQNQTDDFTGFIAHSSNLALKGIVGIGAMGQMSALLQKTADANVYTSTARSYIAQWVQKSQDPNGPHLMLAYGDPNTWSLKYNAMPDRLLGLNLIPTQVLTNEAAWYRKNLASYGVPLDVRHTYTKADWEMWMAAALDDASDRAMFIDTLYNFANFTPSNVPFTDWFDTVAGTQSGFQARPVVGGVFSLLARQAAGTGT